MEEFGPLILAQVVRISATNPMPTAVSSRSVHMLDGAAVASVGVSSVLAQNRALLIPFVVTESWVAQRVAWINTATINGNVCVGVYDATGNRLATTGSVPQAGAGVKQSAPLTSPPTLAPGRYFLAFVTDSATATFNILGVSGDTLTQVGARVMNAAGIPLPATVTFATPAANEGYPTVSISNSTTH